MRNMLPPAAVDIYQEAVSEPGPRYEGLGMRLFLCLSTPHGIHLFKCYIHLPGRNPCEQQYYSYMLGMLICYTASTNSPVPSSTSSAGSAHQDSEWQSVYLGLEIYQKIGTHNLHNFAEGLRFTHLASSIFPFCSKATLIRSISSDGGRHLYRKNNVGIHQTWSCTPRIKACMPTCQLVLPSQLSPHHRKTEGRLWLYPVPQR